MDVTIYPSIPHGNIRIPSSKSIAHRAIICSGLSKGRSSLFNIDMSNDISATINAIKSIGAKIEYMDNRIDITGLNTEHDINSDIFIDCLESASTLRFIAPLISMFSKTATLTGSSFLLSRPHGSYKDILKDKGLDFKLLNKKIEIRGNLLAGDFLITQNVSSQFISGLLFALPMLTNGSNIYIKPDLESKPYIDLTIQTLNHFGINVSFTDELSIKINGGQTYKPSLYNVESDFSQAAFFLVLGALVGDVSCMGLDKNSKQGDRCILDILTQFGVEFKDDNDLITPTKNILTGTNISVSNCPDLAPVLAVLASFCNGKTIIYNAERLALKESNRLYAITKELKKLGVNISHNQNSITIEGKNNTKNHVVLNSHNDHRIAMSLAIFIIASKKTSTIKNAECVEKSYPNFFNDLKNLGIELVYHD